MSAFPTPNPWFAPRTMIVRTVLAFVACVGLLSSAGAFYTLHAQGISSRALLRELVQTYGTVDSAQWVTSAERVTANLASVSEPLNDRYDVTLLNAPGVFNAAALDGGHIVVFSGALKTFDSLLAQHGLYRGSAEYETAFDNLLAGIIGHEIAHLLLGHSTLSEAPDSAGSADELNAIFERRQASRAHELEADRLGVLLLVRAGYSVEAMYLLLEMFRRLEAGSLDVRGVSYLRTHPRPSEREANLDVWKGELKRNQARVDDAVALIHNNIALDVAIALLDTALTFFPQLVSLRHNRATAWHRVWLNSLGIDGKTPASAFALYAPDVVAMLRTEPDQAAYREAVSDYLYVVERYTAPKTLSQLAALIASRGDIEGANILIKKAAAVDSTDPLILANMSAIQLYAKQYEKAYNTARMAIKASRDDSETLALAAFGSALYNLALSARALGRVEESNQAFQTYAKIDSTSRFGRLAASSIGIPLSGWRQLAQPVGSLQAIQGISIGDPRVQIEQVLGTPEVTDSIGDTEILAYPSRGLSLHLLDGECALVIASRSYEGAIRGVRLGDTETQVVETLGAPRSISATGWFDYPSYHMSVRIVRDRVSDILIRG